MYFFNEIDSTYRDWICHGEAIPDKFKSTNVRKKTVTSSLNDDDDYVVGNNIDMMNASYDNFVDDSKGFEVLLKDAEKPLYLVCTKFTKLSTLINCTTCKQTMNFFFIKALVDQSYSSWFISRLSCEI